MSNYPLPPGNPPGATPEEIALLNEMRRQGLTHGQVLAALNMPDTETRILSDGRMMQEVPIAEPQPWLQIGNDVAWVVSDRNVQFVGGANSANQEVIDNFTWQFRSSVFALVGSVKDDDFTAAENIGLEWWQVQGLSNPLDAFTIQFYTTSNRNFQTTPVPGSMVLGSARWPRYLGRPTWSMKGGSSLNVRVTPLFNNLTITIGVWVVETVTASNMQSIA